jgi:sRNA-binding protein
MAGAPFKFKQAITRLTMAEKQMTTTTTALQCARDDLDALQRELEKAQKAYVVAEQNMSHATQEVANAQAEVATARADADHIKQTEEENTANAFRRIDQMMEDFHQKAFWYSPQFKRYGRMRLPSFIDRQIILDVIIDPEKTEMCRLPTKTYTCAIKCMSINDNQVVVFCNEDPRW